MSTLDRTQAPEFQLIKDYELPKPLRSKLSNGLQVFSLSYGTSPVVAINLTINAPKSLEHKKGVAQFVASALLEGTKKRSSEQINALIDQFGASIEVSSGQKFFTISIHSLNKFLRPMLELVEELLFEATFPDDQVDLLLQRNANELAINEKKNSFLASKYFRETLFGADSSLGYALSALDLNQITPSDLQQFYAKYIQGHSFEIFIAGKVDDVVLAQVEQVFGKGIYITSSERKAAQVSLSTDLVEKYEQKEDSVQTSLRLGRALFPIDHKDLFAFDVCNEIFGGYFGSRLMQEIRENLGYTYGISSSFVATADYGYLLIGSDVKKEFAQDAVQQIIKQAELLQNELVSEQELFAVKNYMSGEFIKSLATPFGLMQKFKFIHFNNLPEDYYDTYVSRIQSVQADQIQEMAQKYLHSFHVILVG